MEIKNFKGSFIEQLRNAQKITERTREYTVGENGKEISITLIPMESSDVAAFTKKLDKSDKQIDKMLESAREIISLYVKQIRDIDDSELEELGVSSKNELINSYFNFNNQSLIMKAIMDFSGESKKEEIDEVFDMADTLKN